MFSTNRFYLSAVCAFSFVALALVPITGYAHMTDDAQEQVAVNTAKLSIVDAIQKTLDQTGGAVLSAELEYDEGQLVYDIEVIKGGQETEYLVDAITGTVSKDMNDCNC